MGREWRRSGGRSSVKRKQRGRSGAAGSGGKDSPSGCMSAVLQLFDFHPSHSAMHPHRQSLRQEPTPPKGVEAAMDSLESVGPLTSIVEEDLNMISVGIQIETRRDTRRDKKLKVMLPSSRSAELSSEGSSSPEPKTPNLVARLMGLDTIPETPSPRISGTTILLREPRKGRSDSGTRSLPETPRMSAARRSSDADPRLSLQLYRESIGEKVVSGRRELIKRIGEEGRSPGSCARQIVRQVREGVLSRRGFGADITNTTRSRDNRGESRRMKKVSVSTKFSGEEPSPRLVATSSSNRENGTSHNENPTQLPIKSKPPAATFSATKDRTTEMQYTRCANHSQLPIKSSTKHKPHQQKPIRDCEKARERFSLARKKQGEPFVTPRTKCNIKSDRKCKRHRSPPPPPPKTAAQELPRRSSQWPNSTRQPYKRDATHKPADRRRGRKDRSAAETGGGTEFHYVDTVLKCAGIHRDGHVSISNWFSPFHPLDPAIFHRLEHPFASLNGRCNRRLLFDLVGEVLAGILIPATRVGPWFRTGQLGGREAVDAVWREIGSFPLADCEVLDDIDALTEGDVGRSTAQSHEACEEAEVVLGLQEDILESLVQEAVAELRGRGPTTASVPGGICCAPLLGPLM